MCQLLTIVELSSYLSVKKTTIYDMVYRKRIPYTKIGNQLRFEKGLIDNWITSRTYIPFDMKICYNKPKVEGEESLK
jgi:excisionase family DNA binding protein